MKHFKFIGDWPHTDTIMDELEENPWLWDERTNRKDREGSPHTGMQDIWVRYSKDGTNREHVPVWYPAWKALPALRGVVYGLMAAVQGEMLGGVLITKIPPGSGIDPHVDEGWHVDYYDKFYVCLQNDPGAVFWCEHDGVKEGLVPREGEVWLFDNRKLHWVENHSERDRITLIVCIRTEAFGRV